MTVHSTAIVGETARLGSEVTIGPYCVIEDEVEIGDRTEIRAHAVIKRFTSLGSDNIVYEGAILGGEPQDTGFDGAESRLLIGSHNRIRENVTIHRASKPGSATEVGSDCFIMAGAHVAHDCRLGDGVILANNVALAGHVHIGDRAFLSGGVVVHQFCRIGRLAMIGGNSKIVQDCLPFVTTDGGPGRACGLNLIGLRRARIPNGDIRMLKTAYRLLLRSGLGLETGLAEISRLNHPLASELVSFVTGSTRGFCHE
ncbi:MAG TPA: acyl-ACP--UDP-N-acetylglucosamine O-acyltransferase [Blastocatellia bacterium]|nr:acyl-ACP--UDP-N-acetylglucosamine O-acyltransferase [Blastocatellia bacterium]